MLRPVLAFVVVVALAAVAHASELPRFGGMYQTSGQPLPMLDSKLEVTIRGPIIEVIVTQRFANRGDQATEATYIFPLPADAAVSAMWIQTGGKTVHAKVAKRAEAQQRYEEAVRAGVVAAVLDQERPDIFTQTVAGIAPRSTVEVSIRYDALAHFYDGAWALALPMVVAPRYVAGTATSRPTTGTGRAPDTDRAPDASRVTPGGAPGAGGATSVTINFVDKAWDITSSTHELAVSGQRVTFSDAKSDHDAVIRWKTATAAGWVEQGTSGGFAAVVVQAAAPQLVRKQPLRCLLVLDRSATSRGDADALAQPLVRQLLGNLEAGDRVAVTGSDQITWAAPSTVQRSLDQSWTQKTGAFDLTKVLQSARPDGAPIVLVTGGLVADDRAAIAAAKKLGVPVHVIGVGPAPARGLLLQLATATGGTARFATPGDDLPSLARSVIADAASPIPPLTVTWGTLAASDVVPGTLPRLGAGQAVLVLARVKKAQTANARAGGELFAIDTLGPAKSVSGATTTVGPLGRRWARSRLEEMLAVAKPDATAVTALALEYGLVSPYTSMVAIGDEVVVHGGTRRSVAVPVSVPAGMKWQEVKKETSVETATTKTGIDSTAPTIDQSGGDIDARPTKHGKDKTGRKEPTTDSKKPEPTKEPKPKKNFDEADRGVEEESADEDAEPKYRTAPAPAEVSVAGATVDGTVQREMMSEKSLLGPHLRLTTSFAGGFARANSTNAGLLAAGARLEFGRDFLLGVDASILVFRDATQGRVMLSFAKLGIRRWLELGIAGGTQFGDGGFGPAGSLSLRYHLPPAPRGSLFLRYDAAYLLDEDVRHGQQTFTLGVEWGF